MTDRPFPLHFFLWTCYQQRWTLRTACCTGKSALYIGKNSRMFWNRKSCFSSVRILQAANNSSELWFRKRWWKRGLRVTVFSLLPCPKSFLLWISVPLSFLSHFRHSFPLDILCKKSKQSEFNLVNCSLGSTLLFIWSSRLARIGEARDRSHSPIWPIPA